ncbi:MAG: hypothetical protein MHM6MM_003535, partial [Cercozoa sp. M6MM]
MLKRAVQRVTSRKHDFGYCLFSTHMELEHTARRDQLKAHEEFAQSLWDEARAFESTPDDRPKYMCTFPYPYMNGKLHVGHAFTLAKAEFMAGYQRLKGRNVLWPFG